jgi:hypothetical protein
MMNLEELLTQEWLWAAIASMVAVAGTAGGVISWMIAAWIRRRDRPEPEWIFQAEGDNRHESSYDHTVAALTVQGFILNAGNGTAYNVSLTRSGEGPHELKARWWGQWWIIWWFRLASQWWATLRGKVQEPSSIQTQLPPTRKSAGEAMDIKTSVDGRIGVVNPGDRFAFSCVLPDAEWGSARIQINYLGAPTRLMNWKVRRYDIDSILEKKPKSPYMPYA